MLHSIIGIGRTTGEANAIIASLTDWKEVFPSQCPMVGVEAFIKCGVRISLIPLLVNYLQEKTMTIKWNGKISTERKLNGGGPQEATSGICEYSSADCVDPNYRFKFVDDLTILEKVNLLLVGLASHSYKTAVRSDILEHNQFIPAEHLKTKDLTKKMTLDQKNPKVMIFNFTDK